MKQVMTYCDDLSGDFEVFVFIIWAFSVSFRLERHNLIRDRLI